MLQEADLYQRQPIVRLQKLSSALLIVAAYVLASRLGTYFGSVGQTISPVWPPAGVALSALLLGGLRFWPAIFVAALISSVLMGIPAPFAALLAAGNTIESTLGYLLIEKTVGRKHPFENGKDVFLFLLLPAALAASVCALIGAFGLFLEGRVTTDTFATAWYTWCLGDLAGIVIVTPFALSWLNREEGFWNQSRAIELSLLVVALGMLSAAIFGELTVFTEHEFPFSFLLIPWTLWIALRFGIRGSSLAALVISMIGTWGTMKGYGPFHRQSQNASLLILQVFTIFVSISGLVLAAVLTEKERIFQRLKRSEQKLRAIFDHAFQHIGLLSPNGIVLAASQSLTEYVGSTAQEFEGKHYCDSPWWKWIQSPNERRQAETALRQASGSGEFQRLEVTLAPPGLAQATFDLSFTPVFDDSGKVIFIIPEARDITELRRTREELRTQASLMHAIIEGTNDSIYAKDLQGRYLMINTAGSKFMGKESSGITGCYDHDLFEKENAESIRKRDLRIVATGHAETYEESLFVNSDGVHTFLASKGPFRDKDGEIAGVVCIARDITERKRIEIELRRSNSELEHFANVASHDLQEPLRMVISHLQLLKRRSAEKLDADSKEFIEFAIDGARRMRDLIQDLLTYSRVSRREVRLEQTDCNLLLEKALYNLSKLIDDSGAIIDRSPLPTLVVDEVRIAQLLQNLIENAIKYRKPGVAPRIAVSAQPTNYGWMFAVEDNGIGIEPQFQQRIFTMFQRLHSRSEYPGTGIGLAICMKVVQLHGGKIWVESTPDAGSVFYFTLPQAASTRSGFDKLKLVSHADFGSTKGLPQ